MIPNREDYVNSAISRHPDLTRAQVEATLTSMYKRAYQSNIPYVPPTDDDVDQELALEQPPITTHTNVFQTDPDEELSEEDMLSDEVKSVPDTHFMSSVRLQSKPSTSKSAFDFRSSSSTTTDGELNSKMHEDDVETKPGTSTNTSSRQAPL